MDEVIFKKINVFSAKCCQVEREYMYVLNCNSEEN